MQILQVVKTVPVLFWLFFVVACSNDANHATSSDTINTQKLIITGSSTIAPLASELARQFELKNPNVRVDVQTGGSSRGISDVRRHIADIGMVSRAIKKEETDITPHLIAIDGISLIVHGTNSITQLNESQIKAIYRGEITNWKTLTGKDAAITVINKAEGRSTLEVFLRHFYLKNREIKAHAIIGDNEQAVKLVEKNPDAIAYVSIGTAEYDIKQGSNIKTLPLNGVLASTKNLSNQTFPLRRELNLITQGELSNTGQAFLSFVQSRQASPVIQEFGFVPPQI